MTYRNSALLQVPTVLMPVRLLAAARLQALPVHFAGVKIQETLLSNIEMEGVGAIYGA